MELLCKILLTVHLLFLLTSGADDLQCFKLLDTQNTKSGIHAVYASELFIIIWLKAQMCLTSLHLMNEVKTM